MFVRTKTSPRSKNITVQIVTSIREGKKTSQKVLRHVGTAPQGPDLEDMIKLGELIKLRMEESIQSSLFTPEQSMEMIAQSEAITDEALPVDLKKIREVQRISVGVHQAYGRMYEELGLHRVLPQSRYRMSHYALFHCVMARIANATSKRASVRALEEELGVRLSLEKVYRMMEHLDEERIERIKELATDSARSLIRGPLDVLFFDCTTLYFESTVEDDLKQKGYSKDGKPQQSQILFALLVTQEGLPVNYEVLPGASFEGHSLLTVIDNMRTKYDLRRVVCVGDRGMFNESNISALEGVGAHYIVGAKLKQLPEAQKALVLDKTHYTGEGDIKTLSFEHKGRRMVVSYSAVRAKKDAFDRQRILDKLTAKLKKSSTPKGLMGSGGYASYVCVDGKSKVSIDEEKVARARQWDGLHAVVTSLTAQDMDNEGVLGQYRGLWQVEATFRVSKHDLKIRPIYHWTPPRINAHIAIAFMTLMCVRHLMHRTKMHSHSMSAQVIRNVLVQVQTSILRCECTGNYYALPSKMCEKARKIYQIMGLKRSLEPYRLKKKNE